MNKIQKYHLKLTAANENLSVSHKISKIMNRKIPIVKIQRLSTSSFSSANDSLTNIKDHLNSGSTEVFANDLNVTPSLSTTIGENPIKSSNNDFIQNASNENNARSDKDISFYHTLEQPMKDKEHNSCLNMNNNSIIIAGSIKIQEEEKYTNSCNNSSGDIISLNDASQGSLMHNTTAASNFSVNLNKNVSLKSESMNIYGFNTHNCKKQDAAENANVHFNTTTYFENNQSINDNLSYLNITDKMSSNHDTLIYNLKGIENLCNDDTEQLAEYAENIMQNSFINESYSPNVNLYTADKSYINLDTLPIQGNNKQMVPNAANEKKVLKDINPYPNINIAAAKSIKPKIVEDKTVSLQLNQRMIDEIA
ncbi:probable basic-leucine zipper transcription factor S [Prorops nasuta]|uniref:probable basic-leucine zipper transcription factor S n=1 Tax=Prorops nasuta TaxID=863751 RepID=UPI0034CDE193